MPFYEQATIEYLYIKKDDKVYKKWRFAGQRHWNYTLTANKEVPIVKIDLKKLYDEAQESAKQFMQPLNDIFKVKK